MIVVAVVSLAMLGKAAIQGSAGLWGSAGLTGIVGLAGAIPCIYALGAWRGSLAAGVAVTQAVLATMLFLLYGMHGSYGAAHALIVVADAATIAVALGAGFRIPRSAAPPPRAQG